MKFTIKYTILTVNPNKNTALRKAEDAFGNIWYEISIKGPGTPKTGVYRTNIEFDNLDDAKEYFYK